MLLSRLVLSANLIDIALDLGTSDKQIGNVNVLSNGGRLQPGCYSDENNVNECKDILCPSWRISCYRTTVPSRNIVDLSFPTLVFLVRLSFKFCLKNLKDSATMFWGRLCFKVD